MCAQWKACGRFFIIMIISLLHMKATCKIQKYNECRLFQTFA